MTSLPEAHAAMARKLAMLQAPKIVGCADAADMAALREYLEAVASIVDPVIAAVGDIAAENAPGGLDRSAFADVMLGAIVDADCQITRAMNRMDEGAAERRADPRGWAKAALMGVD